MINENHVTLVGARKMRGYYCNVLAEIIKWVFKWLDKHYADNTEADGNIVAASNPP